MINDKYRGMAGKNMDNEPLTLKGEHSFKLSVLELVSGQSFNYATLTKDESIILIKTLVDNYSQKKKNREIYGGLGLSTCGWALNKLLVLNNANEKFIDNNKSAIDGNILGPEELQKILDNAQGYLESLIK